MLAHIIPASDVVVALRIGCFNLVLAFEVTNGFHDTSNAIATAISNELHRRAGRRNLRLRTHWWRSCRPVS